VRGRVRVRGTVRRPKYSFLCLIHCLLCSIAQLRGFGRIAVRIRGLQWSGVLASLNLEANLQAALSENGAQMYK
jgi:hypothetical protein